MALAEYPSGPVHDAAVAIKQWVRDRLVELVADLHVADPEALGDQLALVLEGVYGSVQSLTAGGPTTQARATAEILLDAHLRATA